MILRVFFVKKLLFIIFMFCFPIDTFTKLLINSVFVNNFYACFPIDTSTKSLARVMKASHIQWLKRSLRSCFSAKNTPFVFYRNFGFNLEISPNHYSGLKKLNVDSETRSYHFLMKTRKKKIRYAK